MADTVVQGLSADPSRIPSKWNRQTVADGDWLQKKTLDKLSARDVYLASAIDMSTSAWEKAVADEYERAIAAEQALDQKIEQETTNRIADVNEEETRAKNAETVLQNAITDETTRATGEESRIEGLIVQEQTRAQEAEGNLNTKIETETTNREEADRVLAEEIEGLKAATDVISVFGTYAQFVNGSADLHATDKDFIKVLADESRNNVQTYYQSTVTTDTTEPATEDEEPVTTTTTSWAYVTALPPYYDTSTIDGKFNEISATVSSNYLSAKGAVHQGKNIVVTEDSTKPEITISTSSNVEFTTVSSTNISATNVTALTVTGNSAKFTNISATNISADLFKSDLGTVDTFNLKFNVANGVNLTATEATINLLTAGTLYGQSKNSNIDSLIGSAESGKFAWNVINSAKFSAVGTTTSTAYISGGFGIEAGQGVGVSLNGKNVVITAEGTTYNAGNYISTANNTISVTGDLITSANAGSAASAWINTNKTKIAYSADFKGSSNVITGYGTSSFAGGISSISVGNTVFTGRNVTFSAGDNIIFTTADNKIGINLEDNIFLNGVESESKQILMTTTGEDIGADGPVIAINNTSQSQLQLYNNKIVRDGKHTTWDKVISASNGNFVSAANNQTLTLATATTAITPASMDNNIIYLV